MFQVGAAYTWCLKCLVPAQKAMQAILAPGHTICKLAKPLVASSQMCTPHFQVQHMTCLKQDQSALGRLSRSCFQDAYSVQCAEAGE